MRPIIYLTAIEDVARSPLIRSQVVTLLKTIRASSPEQPLLLVALYPVANWLRFRQALANLRAELGETGIRFHVLPLAFLTRHFYIRQLLLPFYGLQAALYALWIALRFRPALVHCRSYPAALAGLMVRWLAGAGLIFDTRSLYPEEGATRKDGGQSGRLSQAAFARWKRLERVLMSGADATTVVSEPARDILAAQYPDLKDRLHVLPTCTLLPTPATLESWRRHARQELGLAEHMVIVYVGSWFSPRPALTLFQLLGRLLPSHKLYFLILLSQNAAAAPGTNDELARQIEGALGFAAQCKVLSAPHERVGYYLAAADLAAQPVEPPDSGSQDPRYMLVARTALSIKLTEYLACELPVMVSQWHGAAAAIVQQHDLGIVYDQSSPDEVAHWLAGWQTQQDSYRARTWEFARDHFAVETVAEGYARLYRQILAQRGR